jgi:glyoxylase-like metal-dependent hydrolase (beta-lactamase superfamily II)
MVSATGQWGSGGASGGPDPTSGEKDQSRLLPILAVERLVRAALLVGVGVILLTHVHADWVSLARGYAARLG